MAKIKNKKLILVMLMTILMVFSSTVVAFAGSNGAYSAADRSSKSNLVVVGDSRIYGIYKDSGYYTSTSYSAVWGGHYGYGYNIISADREKKIKSIVVNTIKKKGSCRLVIEGTINDASSKPSALMAFAKRAHGWTAKYNGKTIYPKVYVTEALKAKNGKPSVTSYNKYLKNGASANKYTYINLVDPKNADYADNLHFKAAFKKSMHKDYASKAK